MSYSFYGITGNEILLIKKFLDTHGIRPSELIDCEIRHTPKKPKKAYAWQFHSGFIYWTPINNAREEDEHWKRLPEFDIEAKQ